MAAQPQGRRSGCLRGCCLGCAGLFAVAVVLILVLAGMRLVADQSGPTPEEVDRERALPAVPQGESEGPGPVAEAPAERAPGFPEPGSTLVIRPPEGSIVLDVRMARFELEPGPPSSPIRLVADYDSSAFDLSEELEESSDGSWTYRLEFGPRGGWLMSLTRGEDELQRVRLVVPQGRPVRLEGRVSMGESDVELGGLWLRSVDLGLSMGSHRLGFSKPAPEAADRFALDGSMGDIRIDDLGNVSPAAVELKHSMGTMEVDLDGRWRADSRISVDFTMGECRLGVPDEVRVNVDRDAVRLGERVMSGLADPPDLPADAPLLTLDIEGTAGGLIVRRR